MTGGASDPELADDLVGVASARLTAAGVPRDERIRALRLLSILSTLADTDLRVRRSLDMVASEFDLPADEAGIWLDDLVAVGAVRLDGTAIVIGGREPSRNVRMTLHDFLDAASELDEAPPRHRLAAALVRPSSGLLAAAAVIALAFVGPAVLDGPSTPVSRTSDATVESPVVATTADTSPDTDRTGTTTPNPVPAPDVSPVLSTPTSTLAISCPVGGPILEVTEVIVDALGLLTVDGTAHNTSGEDLTVDSFTLRALVEGQEITAPGTAGQLVVPAHATVLWQARLPAVAPVVTPAGTLAQAALGDWDWVRPEARIACTSP